MLSYLLIILLNRVTYLLIVCSAIGTATWPFSLELAEAQSLSFSQFVAQKY